MSGDIPKEMSATERRLAQANEKKEEGNAAFRLGDYRKASFNYKQAGMLLRDLASKNPCANVSTHETAMISMLQRKRVEEGLSAEQQSAVDDLFAANQSNLAAAHLKLGRFKEAEVCASEALYLYERNMSGRDGNDLSSSHQRAYFRRAQARTHLGELDLAKHDLSHLSTADSAVAAQFNLIEELASKQRERERRLYANLFDSR